MWVTFLSIVGAALTIFLFIAWLREKRVLTRIFFLIYEQKLLKPPSTMLKLLSIIIGSETTYLYEHYSIKVNIDNNGNGQHYKERMPVNIGDRRETSFPVTFTTDSPVDFKDFNFKAFDDEGRLHYQRLIDYPHYKKLVIHSRTPVIPGKSFPHKMEYFTPKSYYFGTEDMFTFNLRHPIKELSITVTFPKRTKITYTKCRVRRIATGESEELDVSPTIGEDKEGVSIQVTLNNLLRIGYDYEIVWLAEI